MSGKARRGGSGYNIGGDNGCFGAFFVCKFTDIFSCSFQMIHSDITVYGLIAGGKRCRRSGTVGIFGFTERYDRIRIGLASPDIGERIRPEHLHTLFFGCFDMVASHAVTYHEYCVARGAELKHRRCFGRRNSYIGRLAVLTGKYVLPK